MRTHPKTDREIDRETTIRKQTRKKMKTDRQNKRLMNGWTDRRPSIRSRNEERTMRFCHFLQSITDGPTDGPMDGRTDTGTQPLIEMRGRIQKTASASRRMRRAVNESYVRRRKRSEMKIRATVSEASH